MFKEIIAKYQGLNVFDIFEDVVKTHPQIKIRFKDYDKFSDLGGRMRGHLLEFAVYHFMNQGAIFNVMAKGADFIENNERFDMKCITLKDNGYSMSGDTPIGVFDNKPYSTSNTIKKLKHLIMPIIDRNLEIIDIREFKAKNIENELFDDWNVIRKHIMNNKKGNCNGSHCKYLRAKKRGDKYYIQFTQNRRLNLIVMSESIALDKTPIKNKQKYMNEIKKEYSNVLSFGDFQSEFFDIGLRGIYQKYVLNNLENSNI